MCRQEGFLHLGCCVHRLIDHHQRWWRDAQRLDLGVRTALFHFRWGQLDEGCLILMIGSYVEDAGSQQVVGVILFAHLTHLPHDL